MKDERVRRFVESKKLYFTVCFILMVFLTGSTIFAAMTAPSKPIDTTDNVIKCAGAGATGVMIEMLGGNLVGAASVHLNTNSMPLFMPVFGTANNSNPDPWLYNAYYNTVSSKKVSNASVEAYKAANGPGTLDTTTIINGTIPILVNRPDFIIGTESDLSKFIKEINNGKSPTSSEYYTPFFGTGAGMANPQQIMDTVSSYAKGMQSVIDKSNGTIKGRYGNPTQIAEDFRDFYGGMMNFCTAKVASLKVNAVKAITVTGITNAEWSVQSGKAEDIFNEYIKAAGGVAIGQEDLVMTTKELLEADVLLCANTAIRTALLTSFDNAGYSLTQIPKLYVIPKGVYGWNLRSPEGALATPWLTSVFYPQLSKIINPVYVTAYFYSNYYHYTGNLEEIIGVVLTSTCLPEGISVDLSSWDGSSPHAITASDTKLTLYVEGNSLNTYTMKINYPEGVTAKSVKYTSSASKIASISSSGKITAKKPGIAEITATITTQTDRTVVLKTSVTVKNAYVSITKSKVKMMKGSSYKFIAKGYGLTGETKWSSSDISVATVNKNGKVIAKKAGSTYITASIYGKAKKIKIIVK